MTRTSKDLDKDLAKLEQAVADYQTETNGWQGLADEWGNDIQSWKGKVDDFGHQLMEWLHGVNEWGEAAEQRFMLILSRIRDLQSSDNHQNKRIRSVERDVKLLTKQRGREETRFGTYVLAPILGVVAFMVWSNVDFRQTVDGLEQPVVYEYAESGWTALFIGIIVALVVYCLYPRSYVLDDDESQPTTEPAADEATGDDQLTAPMGTPAVTEEEQPVGQPSPTS